jgi:hypothetical protein
VISHDVAVDGVGDGLGAFDCKVVRSADQINGEESVDCVRCETVPRLEPEASQSLKLLPVLALPPYSGPSRFWLKSPAHTTVRSSSEQNVSSQDTWS